MRGVVESYCDTGQRDDERRERDDPAAEWTLTRYALDVNHVAVLGLPRGSRVISCGLDRETDLYFMSVAEAKSRVIDKRIYRIIFDGQTVKGGPPETWRCIGTFGIVDRNSSGSISAYLFESAEPEWTEFKAKGEFEGWQHGEEDLT